MSKTIKKGQTKVEWQLAAIERSTSVVRPKSVFLSKMSQSLSKFIHFCFYTILDCFHRNQSKCAYKSPYLLIWWRTLIENWRRRLVSWALLRGCNGESYVKRSVAELNDKSFPWYESKLCNIVSMKQRENWDKSGQRRYF